MKETAGTLLYRRKGRTHEVLLVKPSGPAAQYGWSIPKGHPNAKESLEDAARRETFEETGCRAGTLKYLGYIDYVRSRKRVHCFCGPAEGDEPTSDSWEVSEAKFVSLPQAKRILHRDQVLLIDLLSHVLG